VLHALICSALGAAEVLVGAATVEETAGLGCAVTVTVACGAAEPLWVEQAASSPMAAGAARAAIN
jgi:hypothetical protein